MLLLTVVLVSALVSFLLVLARSYNLLIGVVVVSGSLQAPLMSLTESSAFQFIDDVPAAFLVAGAALQAMTKLRGRHQRALLVILLFILLSVIAMTRSPDLGVAAAQARQVLLPFGLIFAGYTLRHQIRWKSVYNCLLLVTVFGLVWVGMEELHQRPLVSPTWYYLEVVGGDRIDLRKGLPPSYFADGVGSEPIFRPGGPYMNPPVMGFLLGLGAFASVARFKGITRILMLIAIAAALYFSYARAGILLFVGVTLIYLVWTKVGKYAALLVSMGLGFLIASTFLEQGNTASHSDGFISGLQAGLTSPLGLGFGTTGYQAVLEGAETGAGSESLMGLYFAWLGWPVIIAACLVAWRLVSLLRKLPRNYSLPIWISISFLLTVASSESASSMASTPVLWVVLGAVLGIGGPEDARRFIASGKVPPRTDRNRSISASTFQPRSAG